jgi:DNA-binding NarL/FixJ family response regulator
VAIDAASADDLMKAAQYDVVLVDPYLTGGVHRDSREMIESVCRTQPAAAVIVLTGYGSPALERIAEGCHVAALLTKPQSIVFLGGLIAAKG